MYSTITAQLQNEILLITISRPSRMNALNMGMLDEIEAAITWAYDNKEIKGVIFTGAGEKAFAAGADISEFSSYNSKQGRDMVMRGQMVFGLIERCPKPVIAAINGIAFGGGCELAMACHLRIAADTARFAQPEVNLGIIPGYGGTQRLVQLVGKTKAMELMLTGRAMDAAEALHAGMLNAVTSSAELLPAANKLLRQVLSKAPVAVAGIIDCVNAHFDHERDGFASEIANFEKCCSTHDFKEGTSAFIEKRTANFTGE